jgi:hypothetical protein
MQHSAWLAGKRNIASDLAHMDLDAWVLLQPARLAAHSTGAESIAARCAGFIDKLVQ